MTSTPPNYQPDGLPQFNPSASLPDLTLAPSPFFASDQFASAFPLPPSPLAPSMAQPPPHSHRHTTSTVSAPPDLKNEAEEDTKHF